MLVIKKVLFFLTAFSFLTVNQAQINWTISVIDSFSVSNWGYFKGYSGIDLIQTPNGLEFSAKKNTHDEQINDHAYLMHGVKTNGNWSLEQILEVDDIWYYRSTSMVLDGSSTPYIFFFDKGWSTYKYVRVAYKSGSSWTIEKLHDSLVVNDHTLDAFYDGSNVGCAYFNDQSYVGKYFITWQTNSGWQRELVVNYNEQDNINWWGESSPIIKVINGDVYLIYSLVMTDGEEPGEPIGFRVHSKTQNGWGLDYEHSQVYWGQWPHLATYEPCVGVNNSNELNIMGYNFSSDMVEYFFERKQTGWQIDTIANGLTGEGWPVERGEMKYSSDGTAYWLQINTNWPDLWLYYRTPDGNIGHVEVEKPDGYGWVGGLLHADLEITSDDYVHVVYGYNFQDSPSIGICESSVYAPSIITDVEESDSELPMQFTLYQNYPNPFNPSTIIKYTLPHNSFVKLKIFDINGEEVKTLVDNKINRGLHTVSWNGENNFGEKVSSGVYFYRLLADGFSISKKLILVK